MSTSGVVQLVLVWAGAGFSWGGWFLGRGLWRFDEVQRFRIVRALERIESLADPTEPQDGQVSATHASPVAGTGPTQNPECQHHSAGPE